LLSVLFSGLLSIAGLYAQTAPTIKEAEKFMQQAEAPLNELSIKVNRATWVEDNFITQDTEALSADAQDEMTATTTELVEKAKRFEQLRLPPDLQRKFRLLRLSLVAPAPKDAVLRKEM